MYELDAERKFVFLFFLLLKLIGCTSDLTNSNLSRSLWNDKVRHAWQILPNTKSLCPESDPFPAGGMRNFYCHLKDISNYPEVERFFGSRIFLKGPHRDGFLILDERFEFGYYNPEFPIFLRETLIPGAQDKAFRILTQPIYDNFIQNLARTYYATYLKLHSNPTYMVSEKERYLKLIKTQLLEPYYHEKYFSFMNPLFFGSPDSDTATTFLVKEGDENFDGNIVKTAVLFWIRRSIDATDKEFFRGLKLLLNTYDSDFIRSR